MQNSDIEIRSVRTRRDYRQFIRFPYTLYKGDPNWVPPLIRAEKFTFLPRKNPYFLHSEVQLFLAIRFGKVVGRISAHEYREHNRIHNDATGFFGFFESIHSQRVANALLNAALQWLKSKGYKRMMGPFNFTVNDSSGILVDGTNIPPMVMMPYNPYYYAKMLEGYGMRRKHDQFAWKIDDQRGMHPLTKRIADLCRHMPGLIIRRINMKDFENEIRKAYHVYSNAWNNEWGSIPPTWEEFYRFARRFRTFGDPNYAVLIELNETPVGVGLAIPNVNESLIKMKGRLLPFGFMKLIFNRKKIKTMRVLVMEAIAGFENRGVDALLYGMFYEQALLDGIQWAELSWTLESNTRMNKILEMTGAEKYKTYRVYEQDIL